MFSISKYVLLPTIIICVLLTWFGCDGNGEDFPPPPTREQALATLDSLINDAVGRIGSDAVKVPPYRPVETGGVYIRDLCNLTIQSKYETVFDKIDRSGHQINSTSQVVGSTYTLDWLKEWQRSSEGTFGIKILDHSLEAVFSSNDSRAQSVKVMLSLSDPVFEEFSSPGTAQQTYEDSLKAKNLKTGGDVLVVGVWKARVRAELDVRDEAGDTVSLSLEAKINELANFDGGIYANESRSSQGFNIVEESSNGATVFAVVLRNLDNSIVDADKVQEQKNLCGADAPLVKKVAASQQNTGAEIAEFSFEPIVDGNTLSDSWAVTVTNVQNTPVSFDYDVIVRDVYGQLLEVASSKVLGLPANESESLPNITRRSLPSFNKSEISVRLIDAECGPLGNRIPCQ